MRDRRGFTLIELLIVAAIVAILAAVVTPIYLGYVRDSRTAEGKVIAGNLWTVLQARGMIRCGQPVVVRDAFDQAGLDVSGDTPGHRWTVTGDNGTFRVDCQTGDYTAPSPMFTVQGQAEDVSFIRVRLTYDASKAPPAELQCSTDGGGRYRSC